MKHVRPGFIVALVWALSLTFVALGVRAQPTGPGWQSVGTWDGSGDGLFLEVPGDSSLAPGGQYAMCPTGLPCVVQAFEFPGAFWCAWFDWDNGGTPVPTACYVRQFALPGTGGSGGGESLLLRLEPITRAQAEEAFIWGMKLPIWCYLVAWGAGQVIRAITRDENRA